MCFIKESTSYVIWCVLNNVIILYKNMTSADDTGYVNTAFSFFVLRVPQTHLYENGNVQGQG